MGTPKEWIKDLFVEPSPRYSHLGVNKRLLRYFEEPEDIEVRYCELVDRILDRCTAIVCMTDTDYCYVTELYGLFPNIKVLKKIEDEKAKMVRSRVKEISNLSGDAALNAFNNLLHDVLGNQ
jgi:hypothetical protein